MLFHDAFDLRNALQQSTNGYRTRSLVVQPSMGGYNINQVTIEIWKWWNVDSCISFYIIYDINVLSIYYSPFCWDEAFIHATWYISLCWLAPIYARHKCQLEQRPHDEAEPVKAEWCYHLRFCLYTNEWSILIHRASKCIFVIFSALRAFVVLNLNIARGVSMGSPPAMSHSMFSWLGCFLVNFKCWYSLEEDCKIIWMPFNTR